MVKFDVHVATQGSEDIELAAAFAELGFRRDALVDRHVTFDAGLPLSACPLIGLHMSKKYDEFDPQTARRMIAHDMALAERMLVESGQTGYAHSEITVDTRDVVISSTEPLAIDRPWPVGKFEPRPSAEPRKWDLHIAIPLNRLPAELADVLACDRSGLYHIDVRKTRHGVESVFRVFTIQGTSSAIEGQKLFDVVKEWFTAVHAPYVEMKQETLVKMVRVGDPMIVPPTIDAMQLVEP